MVHQKEIKIDNSPPEGQNTYGFNEQHWATIQNMARKMLVHSRLSIRFFVLAAQYTYHIRNVLPVKKLLNIDGKPTTPYELFHKKPPKIAQYRIFGCSMINGQSQTDK